MESFPIVLSIAASDSSSETGIQADVRTITALNAYAATALTAIVAQNRKGLDYIHPMTPEIIQNQVEFVMETLWPDVVKIGLINDVPSARIIADALRKYHPQYVIYDPELMTFDGFSLADEETVRVIREEMLQYTNLITINLIETEVLFGHKIETPAQMEESAQELAQKYKIPVLIKGGNLVKDSTYDILAIPHAHTWAYTGTKIVAENIHGLSTIFSAAISTYLAHGETLNIAVKTAREYVEKIILEDTQKNLTPQAMIDTPPLLENVRMQIYTADK